MGSVSNVLLKKNSSVLLGNVSDVLLKAQQFNY